MRGFSIGMAEAVREIQEMTPEQLESRQRKLDSEILEARMRMRELHAAQAMEIIRNYNRRYYG
ncbi:MAG: hypothetical protein AAB487_02090 [Patescibacteria group bacterium]